MRLSIVVPALDEAAGIAATLRPLQPLRADGHEIIVVDGGSLDATAAIAAPLADAVIVAPRGRAVQMNAGAAKASGDVLVFLHADTAIAPEDLIAMRVRMAAGRWSWGRFDVRIAGSSPLLAIVARAMNLRSRLSGIATGDQAMFVHRAAFARVGGFPIQPLMEDIALSRRLKHVAGRPLCLRARVLTSGRRWAEHGVLQTISRMWWLRFRYWRGADPAILARLYPAAARSPCVLQVFAKAPVPGSVKTRLAAGIGPDEAARVHAAMVERTLETAAAAREAGIVDAVELWCAPDATHAAFARWSRTYGASLRSQAGDSLGDRMAHATTDALRRGARPILVGTDCPVLAPDHLAAARTGLEACDAVFVPAEDGGYVLVGLARILPVFEGVAWGTGAVMATTRARLQACGAAWRELDPLWDLDRPADLARWHGLQAAESPGRATQSRGPGGRRTSLLPCDSRPRA